MSNRQNSTNPVTDQERRTRVLFVDHTPIMGGAQISLLELVRSLDRSRFQVGVACTDRCPRLVEMLRESDADVHVIQLPRLRGPIFSAPARLAATVASLTRVCKLFRPDIVHSNSARTHVYGALAAKLTGAKTIWTLRDFEFPRRLFGYGSRFADAIICISDAVYDGYNSDRKCAKARVIRNGIAVPPIDRQAARQRIRGEFGLSDEPLVGSVGRMLPWKGQREFLRAAALVSRQIPECRFLLMGNPDRPEYVRELEALSGELQIRDKVIFAGFREDVLECMCALDVLAHTATEPEPFGRVVIEAMYVGTPVIASPLGGPLEILEEGRTGIFADPENTGALANAIIRLLTDKEFAAGLAQDAQTVFSERFDQHIETQEVEAVYDEIMNAR